MYVFCMVLQAYSNDDIAGSYSVSFPKGFEYGPDNDGDRDLPGNSQEIKPRVLLMGLRRYACGILLSGTV